MIIKKRRIKATQILTQPPRKDEDEHGSDTKGGMEGVLYSSMFKLNLEKFFSEEEMMRRNSFFVVSVSLKVLIPINWLINPRIFM